MPPDMAISMRHTKLTAKEAAVIAGEVQKPGWQSKNEGIHERVSFEDAIWGFDLAGGSFYKTPLRVVGVKPDSRAEKAGIRPGDRLKRINDIDTSTLSIQEAHAIIIESGIHLKIAVTAPEDEEDSYHCYEDPLETGYDSDEERRLEEERARKREVHAKVSSYWSLQWPWVSKRRIIYRESNCFMVPSKYEGKNRSKFPVQPLIRQEDDIVLHKALTGEEQTEAIKTNDKLQNGLPNENSTVNGTSLTNGTDHKEDKLTNGTNDNIKENGVKTLPEIVEKEEESIQEVIASEKVNEIQNTSVNEEESIRNVIESQEANGLQETSVKEEESIQDEAIEEEELSELDSDPEEKSQTETSEVTDNQDDVINEVLENNDITMEEEDKILDGILSDSEANSINER